MGSDDKHYAMIESLCLCDAFLTLQVLAGYIVTWHAVSQSAKIAQRPGMQAVLGMCLDGIHVPNSPACDKSHPDPS